MTRSHVDDRSAIHGDPVAEPVAAPCLGDLADQGERGEWHEVHPGDEVDAAEEERVAWAAREAQQERGLQEESDAHRERPAKEVQRRVDDIKEDRDRQQREEARGQAAVPDARDAGDELGKLRHAGDLRGERRALCASLGCAWMFHGVGSVLIAYTLHAASRRCHAMTKKTGMTTSAEKLPPGISADSVRSMVFGGGCRRVGAGSLLRGASGRRFVSVIAGQVWMGSEFVHGWLRHDGQRIVGGGEGEPPEDPVARGVVLPAPLNAHTHVGDRVARGRDLRGLTLAQVVAPPDGLKHRILRETTRERLLEGVRAALAELEASGSRSFIDFREGGADGALLVRDAAGDTRMKPVIYGRVGGGWTDADAEAMLGVADGFGLSGLADSKGDVPERAAALARRLGKRFALHFSEDKREDAARAVALRPDFLVHGVHCTREDLASIAEARIPLVLCPRSNALFGAFPDLPAMLDAGVPLALGSDNAMFHPLDVLLDARLLAERYPRVPKDRIVEALVGRSLRAPDDHDIIVLGGDIFGREPPPVTWRSWSP